MVSVASCGTADRIAARILFKVLRAGSGTPARYSSTLFGAPFPCATEPRLADSAFFTRTMLREPPLQVHAPDWGSVLIWILALTVCALIGTYGAQNGFSERHVRSTGMVRKGHGNSVCRSADVSIAGVVPFRLWVSVNDAKGWGCLQG